MAGKVKTVSVKREGRKWFVVVTAEQGRPEPLPATGSMVGVDLGIASFLADSDGAFVLNPHHGRRAAAKLEAAQQALSRFPRRKATDRTANHRHAVEKVAQLHGKVRRQRRDHAHKIAPTSASPRRLITRLTDRRPTSVAAATAGGGAWPVVVAGSV
ncbi:MULTISPECIES: transposase [unclassified Streptomyces]|uniref:transposase n=1 Tax=unclassified Streptomyces TaxID=2593676 RepID=UPI0037FEDEB3